MGNKLTVKCIEDRLDQSISEMTTVATRLHPSTRRDMLVAKDGLKQVRAEFTDAGSLAETILHEVTTEQALDAIESFVQSAGLVNDVVDRLNYNDDDCESR